MQEKSKAEKTPSMKMNPDLQFSVLCEDVIQDKVTGRFVLHGLFENIGFLKLPAIYPRLFIVNRWCNGVGEFEQRTRIINPDKENMLEDKKTCFQLKNNRAKYTVISQFNNLNFRLGGTYWIEIFLDEDLALTYPFEVKQMEIKPK